MVVQWRPVLRNAGVVDLKSGARACVEKPGMEDFGRAQ